MSFLKRFRSKSASQSSSAASDPAEGARRGETAGAGGDPENAPLSTEPDAAGGMGFMSKNKSGIGQTHAREEGHDSAVPQPVQKAVPESVERALPNKLHDTGDE